ncbi:MAG: Lipid A biosynthesis lauroyl acyltransferase [Betaproteobacteria bacterium ADurb.Bin341]|nr:MAG: Lipid A biosynthesis lauroyl acyltransferase [Betaproteobacteria bacterium ADurb.Bin341]
MKSLFSHLAVFFLWLLHWLPLPVLRFFGGLLGRLLFVLGRERRMVALTNLRLCFPERSESERIALARRHFIAFARAFLDRTLGWWASPKRLAHLIRLSGGEHLKQDRPVIILAPHFVGLDAGGTMMTMTTPLVSVYSNQKNPVFSQVLLNGRLRFNQPVLLSRQDGMRKAVKALKDGYPFYYLPDMDFGPQDSIFAPFFGVPAATLPTVSRLARLTGACVVPCICRQVADGYEISLQPAWENFPGESVEADTERMNRFIENEVRQMPEQYFWLHKRFKTRPPGEERFYP